MMGFTSFLVIRPSLSIPTLLPLPRHCLFPFPSSHSLKALNTQPFLVFAVNNNNSSSSSNTNYNNEVKELGDKQEQLEEEDASNSSKQKPSIFSFNWNTIFDPDPDNVLALGLTGLLTWASAQVLWQLLFISFAILVAALKYSFIAALLIFILITLL